MAAAASFAVAAALCGLFARGGVHFPAIIPFGFAFAVGAVNLYGKVFYKFFKFFSASGAFVL